ncbi:uncharacterized protein LOC135337020 isoform X2 [Halichondria panicea]|uniref:uncharacterized protein LOC135337020 isoform X2 n=1 Tax=Halichondria panicea TaxID=6063 RepID=UPI00312B8916
MGRVSVSRFVYYTGDFLLPSKYSAIIMLEGLARKLGLGLAGFTILPWLLIVIGFGWFTTGSNRAPVGSGWFPYWFISLLGIPIIVLGAVHAIISARSAVKIIRTATTVLSVVFLLCLGMIFFDAGGSIIIAAAQGLLIHPVNLLFAGTLIGTLSWTGQMVAWTFYEMPEEAIINNQ